jgi:ABC-type transport system substrate-binding protein
MTGFAKQIFYIVTLLSVLSYLSVDSFPLPATASLPNLTEKKIHVAVSYLFEVGLDPVEYNFINLHPLQTCLYCRLFRLDQDLRPQKQLVERFERNGKKAVLYLPKNARFSDGSPITAQDVKTSLEKAMSSETSPNPFYRLLEGGNELATGKASQCKGIIMRDSHTIELDFKYENVDFGTYLSAITMSILPAQRKRAAYSGPFALSETKEKSGRVTIKLQRNSFSPSQKGSIDVLYFHFYRQQEDFEQAVMRGTPDIFFHNLNLRIPPSKYKYNLYKTPMFGAFYIKLNPVKGPFQDKQLRVFFKNFLLSTDFRRQQKWKLAAPANLVLPYSLTGYSAFNPMQPAEYKSLAPKKPVTVRCYNPKTELRKQLLPVLKKKLAPFNVNLDLHWETLGNIDQMEREGNIHLTSVYYLADVPLSYYFYENLFIPGLELNRSGYIVQEALQQLENYRNETNAIKRLKILSNLEKIAQEEAYFIPLVTPLAVVGYKNHIKNLRIDKFLSINFGEINVENRYKN